MGTAARPQYVQVPVPEDLVEDVYAFLTARRRQLSRNEVDPDPSDPSPSDETAHENAVPDTEAGESADAADGWDAYSLHEFLDRANSQLRELLVYLAERSPIAVPADEVLVAVGLTPGRSAGGFLSRAGRSSQYHYGRDLPLEKDWNGDKGRYDYWVDKDDAAVILAHAKR